MTRLHAKVYMVALLVVVIAATCEAGRSATKHSHRFLVAKRVQHGLRGTPLRGLGFIFEAEGYRTGLSPFFLVGASGTESSLGLAACRGNRFNIWGVGACGRAWREPHFESWGHAIRYYADFIRRYWPSARTVYDLNGYCTSCAPGSWGNRTSWWMQRLFGDRSGSILYPKPAK